MMFCLLSMSSIAVKMNKSEITTLVNTWAKRWNISNDVKNSEFLRVTGANPVVNTTLDVAIFNMNYKNYVKAWFLAQDTAKAVKTVKLNKSSNKNRRTIKVRAFNDNILVQNKQEQINNSINKWAIRWNVASDVAVQEYAKLTNTNPYIETEQDIVRFNEDYMRYLVKCYAQIRLERMNTDDFMANANIMVDNHVIRWFKERHPQDDIKCCKDIFALETGINVDIKTFDDVVEFELRAITLPQYYKLGLDKV